MTRISLLTIISVLVLYSCSGPEPPNILLINIDDMGWRDTGFMGSDFYETPFMDRLASEGKVFMQGYASAANCAPSRACLMSGQWTPRHGIYTVGNSDRGESRNRKLIPVENTVTLQDTILTLPDILHANGYLTIHSGKWHLSDDPLDYGFDINIGGSQAGHPQSYYPPYNNVDLEAPAGEYLTDRITSLVIDTLGKLRKRPFFLNYSTYAVHTPIHKIDSLMYKFSEKPSWKGQDYPEYATMINNLDRNIGDLIRTLKESGEYDHTFIIFTSDNGGPYHITKQKPLRAGKGSYFEGGIRVPLFFVWKGKIEPSFDGKNPVTNLDFYPTILDVTGITRPENKVLDGKSLLPLLTGNGELEERALYWHFPIYLQNGNQETHDTLFRTRPGSVIRKGKWKLHQYDEDNRIELYDLDNDIGEQINLADSLPLKTKEMVEMLYEWHKHTSAPIPTTANPDYDPDKSYKP